MTPFARLDSAATRCRLDGVQHNLGVCQSAPLRRPVNLHHLVRTRSCPMAVQDVTVLSPVTLDDATIEALRTSLRGELLRLGDDGYDAARMVHNGMIDKHPALIARCAGATDVMRAVDFAREHQLVVSVRGGGHNVTGNAVSDGGLMIDLALMKGLRIDPATRTARCEAGLT